MCDRPASPRSGPRSLAWVTPLHERGCADHALPWAAGVLLLVRARSRPHIPSESAAGAARGSNPLVAARTDGGGTVPPRPRQILVRAVGVVVRLWHSDHRVSGSRVAQCFLLFAEAGFLRLAPTPKRVRGGRAPGLDRPLFEWPQTLGGAWPGRVPRSKLASATAGDKGRPHPPRLGTRQPTGAPRARALRQCIATRTLPTRDGGWLRTAFSKSFTGPARRWRGAGRPTARARRRWGAWRFWRARLWVSLPPPQPVPFLALPAEARHRRRGAWPRGPPGGGGARGGWRSAGFGGSRRTAGPVRLGWVRPRQSSATAPPARQVLLEG